MRKIFCLFLTALSLFAFSCKISEIEIEEKSEI